MLYNDTVDDSDLKIGIGIQFYLQNKEFLCVIGYIKTNLFLYSTKSSCLREFEKFMLVEIS